MPKKPAATPRRRCAIYVRISNDKRDQAGVKRQEKDCRELAAQLGWDVVVVYSDNDREASSGRPRPDYLLMLDDMRSGRIDAVVGWHSDRIVRRPDELEELIKLADQHDVLFAAVQVGNLDLSTASGRLVARLLGATAKYETELKAERQKAQLRQLAHAGLPTGGGTRPFGYEKGWMDLRPDEAKIVRELADRLIAGESVNSLTDWLIDTGVPTVRGGPWHAVVVRNLLLSPRIAGLSTWDGEVVAKGQWPAIIAEDEHRQLAAILKSRGNQRKERRARVALLPGLIWCGKCGYELVTFGQARPVERMSAEARAGLPEDQKWVSVRSYGCRTHTLAGRPGYRKSCGAMSIKAEWAEDDVAERLLARLARSSEKLSGAAAAEPATGVAAELGEAEERLRGLGVDYADGLLGRTEFLAARDRLQDRIHALQGKLAGPKIVVPIGDPVGLVGWWENANLSQRQALVKQYVDRVEIHAHSGRRSDHDPSRVRVEWR